MAKRILRNDDFYEVEDEMAYIIADSINTIVKTSLGERVGEPTFGCNIRTFLFDLENVLLEDIETDLVNAVLLWEPRVEIKNISLTNDSNQRSVEIVLELKVIETNESLRLTAKLNTEG